MKHGNQGPDADGMTRDTIALHGKPLLVLCLSVGVVDCEKETR